MSHGREVIRRIINIAVRENTPVATSKQIDWSRATPSVVRRRRSLTLSTTSGLPFTVNPSSRYHQVTKQLVERTSDDFNNPIKTTRKSSGVTSLPNPEKLCPFHAMISRERQSNGLDVTHAAQTSHVFPNLGAAFMQRIFGQFRGKSLKDDSNLRQSSSLLSTLTTRKRDLTSTTYKSYGAIPGPQGLPFLGSVLDYTFLGSFRPREFHKAIQTRHAK